MKDNDYTHIDRAIGESIKKYIGNYSVSYINLLETLCKPLGSHTRAQINQSLNYLKDREDVVFTTMYGGDFRINVVEGRE